MENRESKNDEMSRGVWKAVETETGKVRVAETEERREKRRSQKETERKRGKTEGGKEKPKEGKKNRSKKNNKGMGDLE